MLCILNNCTDPYFNIAAEEYFLKNFTRDFFIMYRNSPCVIIGKHQNTLAEINTEYIFENNVKVVRRISGGGTVYHDFGNLNFTFIKNGKYSELNDFKKYTKLIIEVLRELSINAKFEGHNSLTINGKKISGNAEHIYKNRVLHHGTLLFSTEIKNLEKALYVDSNKYDDRAVKSIRSQVTRISDYLKTNLNIFGFRNKIFEYVLKNIPEAALYVITEQNKKKILELVELKYADWNWNFGNSPKYSFKNTIKTGNAKFNIRLLVEKGIIKEISILPEGCKTAKVGLIQHILKDVPHKQENIYTVLYPLKGKELFIKLNLDEFVKALF
jgi:lipoate-protein ligase A